MTIRPLLLVLASCGSRHAHDARTTPATPPIANSAAPASAIEIVPEVHLETVSWVHYDALPPLAPGHIYIDTDVGGWRGLVARLYDKLSAWLDSQPPWTLDGRVVEITTLLTRDEPRRALGIVGRIRNDDGSVEILQCWDPAPAIDRFELCRRELERLAPEHRAPRTP